MNSVLVNLTSKIGFHKSIGGVSDFTQNGMCQEEVFRYLLDAEQKRSKRSGHNYYILLVYRTDDEGVVVRMDSYVAGEILDALARSLRETDYIGWYREGYVAGGVLTVVEPDSIVNMHERVQRRLKEIIENHVDKQSGSLQVKLCRQHELRGVEIFGQKAATVQ